MDPLTLAGTAVTVLSPYLANIGETAAEEVGKKLPEAVGRVWHAIMHKFKGNAAAEEVVKCFVAKPDDEDYRAGFRKELRKMLEAEPALVNELARLLEVAKRQSSETIINTGSGAVATSGGVAAGAGGVAVRGDVQGGINIGGVERKG
jgi:hypothetical protein